MFEWYHLTLLGMALVAVLLAWRVSHAVTVVGVGVLFYAITASWHNLGLSHGVLFGGFTSFVMCIGLYGIKDDAAWIGRIFCCYILMILVDLLFLAGVIETQYIFAVTLEAINAYALLLISAAGIAERLGDGHNSRSPYRWLLASFNSSLLAKREAYSRWWRHP